MNSDKVSIIIPVYNANDYIEDTIYNILNQSYKNIEIIIIDDGSTDGTYETCKRLQRDNVICLHQENAGPSRARNFGIDNAKGKYVIFLDSDDDFDEHAILKLVTTANENNADIVICGFSYIKGIAVEKIMINCEERLYKQVDFQNVIPLLLKNCILANIGTKLYLKDLLKCNNIRFKEEYKIYEDITFCLSTLKYASNIYCIKECLYNYKLSTSVTLHVTYKENYYESVLTYLEVLHDVLFKNSKFEFNSNFFIEQTNLLKIEILKNYLSLEYQYFKKICLKMLKKEVFDNFSFNNQNLSLNKRIILFLFKNRQFKLIYWILNIQKRITRN